ncbi:MAG: GNAT family N-acetyltransferase [Clostridiaceae bacterium]
MIINTSLPADTSSSADQGLLPCQFIPCTQEDLAMILEPALQLLQGFQKDITLDLSTLKTLLTNKTRTELPEYSKVVVADVILGWYHLIHRTNSLELDDVNIREPYRCQGFGRLILDRVKQEADFLNIPVSATVQKDNLRAIRFYQHNNFVLMNDANNKYLTLVYLPNPQISDSVSG